MKTFKEYLSESKKSYPFRLKVAGDLPENFVNGLKDCIGKANPTIIEKSKTPIQATPLDFPELSNMEVHVFEVVCEYPITAKTNKIEKKLKAVDLQLKKLKIDQDAGNDPNDVINGQGYVITDRNELLKKLSGKA